MKLFFTIYFSVFLFSLSAQSTLNEVNSATYMNFAESYNYTYWNQSWKTATATDRQFTNQASTYAFQVDYKNLNIDNLVLNDHQWNATEAFEAIDDSIFNSTFSGDISYAILHSGINNYTKAVAPTNMGNKDSQLAEYGTWCNRRFVSTNFTNNPAIESYFTGIEFATWHDRFKMTFHVRPTASIVNGQLQLSFTMPAAYGNYYTDNTHHAFGLDAQKGFVIKSEDPATSIVVSGNTITLTSNQQVLNAGQSYEISLIFKPLLQNLSTGFSQVYNEETPVSFQANQSHPSAQNLSSNITYSAVEGMHTIDLPRYVMGQYNCNTDSVMQQVDFSLTNSSSIDKRVKLCFRQVPNTNVTGFNSLLCNKNGDPSGLPIQVSKNWHTGTAQLFSGSWIKEYTEIIVPANSTLNLMYKRTGAKWGETYTASSHQLSVVGAGVPRGGWLEAALGSYGESVTHSPDMEYGNSNVCDVRPFLVTNANYGGTSTACNWTGNVGGLELWVYKDQNNVRQQQSEVKTRFNRYSPNLTETTIGAISADEKLKLEYRFFLNRSDDYNRLFYKVKIQVLDTVDFNRFDFFQLGGDTYNYHTAQQVVVGNDTGVIAQFLPTNNGANDYTTAAMALSGDDPWIWAGDGFSYGNLSGGLAINTNNGLIIRDYQATLNGTQNNTPYLRERSSSQGFSASYNTNPTSYCLVPPPTVTSFHPGDEIEMLLEVVILPKTNGDYYGPNQNFQSALAQHGNTYNLLFREVTGNQVMASSPTNAVDTNYPISISTQNNTALVELEGGLGYVPLVFKGLDEVDNPVLWQAIDSCWEIVDQSVHGKDFWQADYQSEQQTFDLTFNVNQDRPNDARAKTLYYLGSTPPSTPLIAQSKVGTSPFNQDSNLVAVEGMDTVVLAPQILYYDSSIVDGIDSNYHWTGPNGFVQVGRIVEFTPINAADTGIYKVYFSGPFGCSDSLSFSVSISNSSCDSSAISILPRYKIGNDPFIEDTLVIAIKHLDTVLFSPQLLNADSTISDGIDSNYYWTGPNSFVQVGREISFLPVSALDSGLYQVIYTRQNGCVDSINYQLIVNEFDCDSSETSIFPRFKIGQGLYLNGSTLVAIEEKDTVLLSPQVMFADSSLHDGLDSNYYWTGPNGFSQIGREVLFEPITFFDQGDYYVFHTDSLACEDSVLYVINTEKDSSDASVIDLNSQGLQLTPNPVNDVFKISEMSQHTWIYDAKGKLVFEEKQASNVFDIRTLPKGVYMVVFEVNPGSVIRGKVVKL